MHEIKTFLPNSGFIPPFLTGITSILTGKGGGAPCFGKNVVNTNNGYHRTARRSQRGASIKVLLRANTRRRSGFSTDDAQEGNGWKNTFLMATNHNGSAFDICDLDIYTNGPSGAKV